jgi:hypothetical protein
MGTYIRIKNILMTRSAIMSHCKSTVYKHCAFRTKWSHSLCIHACPESALFVGFNVWLNANGWAHEFRTGTLNAAVTSTRQMCLICLEGCWHVQIGPCHLGQGNWPHVLTESSTYTSCQHYAGLPTAEVSKFQWMKIENYLDYYKFTSGFYRILYSSLILEGGTW